MNHRSFLLTFTGFGALLLTGCGGAPAAGGAGGGSGSSGSNMVIVESSNGFGKLLPHRIPRKDANGLPTSSIVEITRLSDLMDNVTLTNPVLPPVEWPTSAVLPNGDPGNHFVYITFSRPIRVESVLESAQSASVDNNLTGNIQIVQVNPVSGQTIPIQGRAFINGMTYGSQDPNNTSQLLLEPWVQLDANGKPIAADPRGLGFPGTESTAGFAGDNDLVSPNTFVFVVDSDGDLTTHERFPAGVQIQMRITRGVQSTGGRGLREEGLASSTVGTDTIPPEVLIAGASQAPVIIPGNGETNVDPETTVEVTFTEPVQVLTVGDLNDGTPPALSAAIQLLFGPATSKVAVPFFAEPLSVFDMSRIKLTPLYGFPGSGPNLPGNITCGTFSQIDVVVNAPQFDDLCGLKNTQSLSTSFTTGEGPGLVNAPVVPDAIYVGRGGSQQSISVIDMNGFGQTTGDPTYDDANPIKEGNTNFPNNPNVKLQGAIMIPPLTQGSCTIDGGSRGVFTLVRDSSLSDKLATSPLLESVGDMAIGHALDATFNNGAPFGCQAGGGNICAATGLKVVTIAAGGTGSFVPGTVNAQVFPLKTEFGSENLAAWAPHPNPPPLTFPPLCLQPLILGEEPTAFLTTQPPPGPLLTNLLIPSSLPLGLPGQGIPPQGIIAREQNAFFQGPSPPQPTINACLGFMIRQQIGQYLYVIDRSAGEVVVFNSNRFTVLDRIPLPDPTSMAMSPNLDFLAVTNQNADQVSFIDIDPNSATFHTVVQTTVVGNGPIGIAWQPDNEDILVCNQAENTLSIISAFTFNVRKVVRNQLRSPFEVCIEARQQAWSFSRNVYYAYILNGDGSVAVFESGPDGFNGWGFDDVIETLPFTFDRPKTMQINPLALRLGFWVVHENQLNTADGTRTGLAGGAVSLCEITSGTMGQIPLDPGAIVNPGVRQLEWGIQVSVGSDQLTGIPVDVAFDDQNNATPLTNISNPFSASTPLSINGKSILKSSGGSVSVGKTPQFMFLAVPNSFEGPGVVDVINVSSGFRRFDTNSFVPGIQSIPATNAQVVVDYFRQ